MEALVILTGVTLVVGMFGLGLYLGFRLFGKRFYNQGYNDAIEDGNPGLLFGECGHCGWEPPNGPIAGMIQALMEHINDDCPGHRH